VGFFAPKPSSFVAARARGTAAGGGIATGGAIGGGADGALSARGGGGEGATEFGVAVIS